MTISRRKVLKSMASAGALALPGGVFAPAIAQAEPVQDRHPGAALGHRRQRRHQRPARHANGRSSKLQRAGGIAGRKIELVVEEETIAQGHHRALPEARAAGEGRLRAGHRVDRRRAGAWDRWWRRRGRSPSSGTAPRRTASRRSCPTPKYLFRSTDNECEAVMSSLLAIKHWKGQFKRIAGINPDYSYGRNNMAAFVALLEALQHRARGGHRAVAEGRHHGADQPRRCAQGRQARPDLLLAAVRRPAGVHEAGGMRPS